MKRLVSKALPKSQIARSVAVLMTGTALAQLLTAASMPFVTRLYTPEMIGVISVYLSFFNFWLPLLTWRYESALLISENEEESHHIFRLGAILCFLMASLAVPALVTLQNFDLFGYSILPSWAPVITFLSLLGYGWFMLYRSWLLRLRDARVISFSAVARSGANAGSRLILGLVNVGVWGLFIAEVLGSWSALGAVRKKTQQLMTETIPCWSLSKVKKAAQRYKKFAQYEMPSSMINQLALVLPVPMVASLYGAQAAGWFGLARLLYAIPNGQIGTAAGDVFQMELGACVRQGDGDRAKKLFYRFSVNLALIGIIPLVLAIFLAPKVVPFIFGEEWKNMGLIVANMAPWMFMALVVSSLSRALSVLEKQHWKLVYDITAVSVVYIIYQVALIKGMSLLDYIGYLSFGMSIAYVIYFSIITYAVISYK